MLMISTFNFKRAIIICLLLGFILGLLPLDSARAEADMVLKDFTVDVWPEYDDPRVLAIYQGTFVNNGSSDFDGYVKFNIPKEAQINMACEIVNGNHLCQPYKTEDKGDYVELKWKTTKIIKPGQEYPVFLEFYYDPIPDKIKLTIIQCKRKVKEALQADDEAEARLWLKKIYIYEERLKKYQNLIS